MPFARRARRAGRTMFLVAALVATYVLFTMAAMKVALRAREIAVPGFVGQELSAAMTLGEAADLSIRVDESKRIDPTVPAGRISAQDPPPGSSVRRGRSVRLWVSAGSRQRLVPRLVGDTQRTALARLELDGLTLASVTDMRSGDYAADAVVAQDPAPGTRTGRVALLVNRGERAGGFVMPDVIGVPGDAALAMLRSGGLRVTIVAQQPYPGVPVGTVLRQNPPAGFQVTGDEPISLEVSR